jgi:hypothetical protein
LSLFRTCSKKVKKDESESPHLVASTSRLKEILISAFAMYREIISLGDENTANARWEPAGTVTVTRQRR